MDNDKTCYLNLVDNDNSCYLNLVEEQNRFIFVSKSKIMAEDIIRFKRKMYDTMLKWKQERNGDTALLIQGARRVGKSTIAEEFARNEYKSYILIDFSKVSKDVSVLFNLPFS